MPAHRAFLILSAAVVFGLQAAAAAAVPEAEPPATPQEVLELSGLRWQLNELPALIESQTEARRSELSAAQYATLLRIFLEAFDPETLYASVVQTLNDHTRLEALHAVRRWLLSPAGRRMTSLEQSAYTVGAREQLRVFVASLDAAPPEPQRLALIERVEKASGGTPLMVGIIFAVARGMAETLPESRRPSDADLRGQIRSRTAEYRRQVLERLLFVYRMASDAELARYGDFLESEDGEWYTQSVSGALLQAYADASLRAGAALREAWDGR